MRGLKWTLAILEENSDNFFERKEKSKCLELFSKPQSG